MFLNGGKNEVNKNPHRPLVSKMTLPCQRTWGLEMSCPNLEHGYRRCRKPFGNEESVARSLRYSRDGLVKKIVRLTSEERTSNV